MDPGGAWASTTVVAPIAFETVGIGGLSASTALGSDSASTMVSRASNVPIHSTLSVLATLRVVGPYAAHGKEGFSNLPVGRDTAVQGLKRALVRREPVLDHPLLLLTDCGRRRRRDDVRRPKHGPEHRRQRGFPDGCVRRPASAFPFHVLICEGCFVRHFSGTAMGLAGGRVDMVRSTGRLRSAV